MSERNRPLVIDTLGGGYRWQTRPGHRAFISPTKADLDARKAWALSDVRAGRG